MMNRSGFTMKYPKNGFERDLKIFEKRKSLSRIGHLMTGGGGTAAAEVTTSLTRHYFGAIGGGEEILEI